MKRQRQIVILVVLLIPALIFTYLNLRGTGDDTRVQLDTIFGNNEQIVELSKEASTNGSQFSLKTAAASLAATTASDNQQLTTYYKDRYGKSPKKFKPAKGEGALDKLKAAESGSGYDSLYKQATVKLLEANFTLLEAIHDQARKPELKTLLETIYDSQAEGLNQLNNLP